jgi:AraC family transcriptional regulator
MYVTSVSKVETGAGSIAVSTPKIVANVNGVMRRPVDDSPLISSADSLWEGFALEQYYTPAFKEFPENIKFSGHIIAMNRCRKPVRFFYRASDRLEREVLIPDGGLGICSSQAILRARQIGASMTFPLFIEDTMMTRVCEESNGGRQVELIQRNGVVDRVLQSLVSAMAADLKSGCPTGRIFGESLATAIAAYVAGKYSVFSTRFAEYRDGLSKQRLNDVIDYIHSNLHGNLGVAEIASVAFMSPYYFGKLFKRSTGQTIHQYVLKQRVRSAQSLLSTTDIGLSEIASSVGLANQSHFTTVFKTRLGVTPGYFRLQFRSRH